MKKDWPLHRIAPFVRWTGEVRVPTGYFRKRRYIFDQILVYVLSGWGEFQIRGKWVHIGAGDLLLIPAGTPTMMRTGDREPMWFRFMRFDYDFVGDYEQRPMDSLTPASRRYRWRTPAAPPGLKLPRKINIADDPRVALIFDRVIHEAETKAPGYELMVRAGLMELLAIVHRRSCGWKEQSGSLQSHPEPIRRALAFMETNVAKPLTLAEIARAAHLSKQHFCRVFHRAVGVTPLRFLVRLRLRVAKGVLWHEGSTVKEAALAAGFEDQHHFTRVFHKLEGITPTDFRRAVLSMDGAAQIRLAQADSLQVRGPFFTIAPRGS
ncbi:MAG: helix-turn-helix transcriptional regulator [Verrucomicrobia bacterium]|nr:helix-turn-helix transcriptional regulator [Verrucomicrobiota bacterium]